MNPIALLVFSVNVLGAFYLFFESAKRLRAGRFGVGDWIDDDFPDFRPPDGAVFVVDDEGHYKFLATDRGSRTVYFLRSSW